MNFSTKVTAGSTLRCGTELRHYCSNGSSGFINRRIKRFTCIKTEVGGFLNEGQKRTGEFDEEMRWQIAWIIIKCP
ncbi:hypothetical protein MKW98_011400 [Papaver atlanticum]|uniref:Uncharacterized protein n=1 Tax=Papaver atlanticum TaxID=357466 RepID=A0AAD4XJE4_9MAGN|nr:hypothetical protein MKW98_011400 [Papaver atlanticum]